MRAKIIDRAAAGFDDCFPAVGGNCGAVPVEVGFESGDAAEALGLEEGAEGEEVGVVAAVCVRGREKMLDLIFESLRGRRERHTLVDCQEEVTGFREGDEGVCFG